MVEIQQDGRQRVRFESLWPQLDGGRFPIKRVVGEKVHIEVDMLADGHDALAGVILYRHEHSEQWQETPLSPKDNDRWWGIFKVYDLGRYYYTVQGWIDYFQTWRQGIALRLAARQDIQTDLQVGAMLVDAAAHRASGRYADSLQTYAAKLRSIQDPDQAWVNDLILSKELAALMAVHPDRSLATTHTQELEIVVDRERARFSTWYELFPRSWGKPGQHGTFRDLEAQLPYIADMGFDVLYLTPIHPIGHTFRKGKNNSLVAEPDDVGVPWAIGSHEGGHMAVHPQLGTLEDFRALGDRAKALGMELALDLAFHCSPDHPYVQEHPNWFSHRPDGSIRCAENPPNRYEDIYPFNFETDDWQSLWHELKQIILFWIDQGVQIFRVDNPHTKPFAFWEWVIHEVKQQHPGVIFLPEAFTRPKLMQHLSKLGFTQSYTYFIWRNNAWELKEYFNELNNGWFREFFRPNLWPTTHDVLHHYLQVGGRAASIIRLILAGTLSASYGIYGPAYELCDITPFEEGSEEFLNSEKYEIRTWDLNAPNSLRSIITRLNQARHQHPALQNNSSLRFHHCTNDQILCYTKQSEDFTDVVLAIVNLDPHNTHAGYVDLPLESLGLDPYQEFQLQDLLTDAEYNWFGGHNYVELNPHVIPAHVFWVKQWEESQV